MTRNLKSFIFIYFAIICNAKIEGSPYDIGFDLLFKSEHTEVSNFKLELIGDIPDWLSGTLVRNITYYFVKLEVDSYYYMIDASCRAISPGQYPF